MENRAAWTLSDAAAAGGPHIVHGRLPRPSHDARWLQRGLYHQSFPTPSKKNPGHLSSVRLTRVETMIAAAVTFRAVRASRGPRVMLACVLAVAMVGCGGSGHGGSASSGSSGGSAVPLTLDQVKANLLKAGYRVTVYAPSEGVLQIDATHKADAGLSIDYSPDGRQLYAAVFETRNPAVRSALISHNSDETTPVVRGDLVF